MARDTVHATVMIITTGVVGLCTMIGGLAHREQSFRVDGAGGGLAALIVLAVVTLVLPDVTLATMERALKSAGLRGIRWHPPQVSPEGLRQSGEEHWRGFLTRPPIVFLECVKKAV